jgi:hypothetical protein
LFWNIKRRYDFTLLELVRVSPRFGILLGAMILSVSFIICDILSVTKVIGGAGSADGINPFWKLAFVFKCLTDTVILDDFKTALDRLKQYKMEQLESMGPDGLISRRSGSFGSDAARRASAKRIEQKRRASTVKPADWEADVEHLNFCTVPDSIAMTDHR